MFGVARRISISRLRRALAVAMAAAAMPGVWGCAAGRVDIAALDYGNIDPPAAEFARVPIDRACWWTDERGVAWVALERDAPSIFGQLGRFVMRFVMELDKPPAGSARNYLVSEKQLRGTAWTAMAESRFTVSAGIVALYRQPGERYRGTFRVQCDREVNRLLGGWSRAPRYLMLGEFVAVHDAATGRRIREQVEHILDESARGTPASQPHREPPPASQPPGDMRK